MAENDRWYEHRDERSARGDTAWRAEDRQPPNDADLEASRGYVRDDDGRRSYGAGDYERTSPPRDDYPRYGSSDRGPAYAQPPRGAWPAYQPGRDSPAFHDHSGPFWGGEAGPSGRPGERRDAEEQNPPPRNPREEREAQDGPAWGARSPGREERNPWFGEDPGRQEQRSEGRSFWDRAREEAASLFGGGGGGEHRGRGPRGYRRSDERIGEDVNDRLTEDSWLDASDIEVRVQGGEVTLDGRVRTRDDKRRAEDIAERVSGVVHVQNNLRIREGREEAERTSGRPSNRPY